MEVREWSTKVGLDQVGWWVVNKLFVSLDLRKIATIWRVGIGLVDYGHFHFLGHEMDCDKFH